MDNIGKWKEEIYEIKTAIKGTTSTTIIRNYKCIYCTYTVSSLNDISRFCPMCGKILIPPIKGEAYEKKL